MKEISKILLSSIGDGCQWCILRKEDEILIGIENDIDIFVNQKDYKNMLTNFKKIISENNIIITNQRHMPCGISYSISHKQETQKVDIIFENTLLFWSIFSTKILLSSITEGAKYPVLEETKSNYLKLKKNNVRKNFIRYLLSVAFLKDLFKKKYIYNYFKALYKNIKNKPGKFIILAGVDGSGKTTLTKNIKNHGKSKFFSTNVYHFNIKIFPRLNHFIPKKFRNEPDYTKRDSGANAPIQSKFKSNIYSIYYGFELIIYSNIVIRYKLVNGCCVIFDRYYHDMLFQRSYRNANKNLIKFFLKLSLKPDNVFILSGDSNKIYERKPELSSIEIEAQYQSISKHLIPFYANNKIKLFNLDTTSLSLPETLKILYENI